MKRLGFVLSCMLAVSACDDTTPLLRVVHEGGTLAGGDVWEEAVHVLEGSITVTGGALEVAACSVIEMPDGGVIKVRDGGSFDFVGAPDCPITVTSSRAAPAAGDWNQLEIESSASNSNTLDWVIVEYGGGSSYGAIWLDGGANLSMSNSTVRDSGHAGLRLYNDARFAGFVNNTLVNNAEGAMHLYASAAADLGVGTYGPNAIDGIIVAGGTVADDATWLAHDAPYLLEGDVVVEGGTGSARLTIEAGATVQIAEDRSVRVRTNGGLTLAGTAASPVTITSAKPVPAAGDWHQIQLENDSVGAYNDFDHAVIEYGGGSSYGQIWLDSGASLAMTDTTVRHSGNTGLRLYNDTELRDFTGNTLTDNAEGPVQLYANTVDDLGPGVYTPNDIEGIRIAGGTVDHDCTWLALDAPYVVEASFDVETAAGGTARLTLAAGAAVEVGSDNAIRVRSNGGLTLAGTDADHVTITSAAAVPAPGDWNQIDLHGNSVAAYNVFTYADITYGGGSSYGQLWVDNSAGVTLDHVVFSHAGDGCDVDAYAGATVSATDSTYTACP